jgi:hypothetical protein
MVRWRMAIDLGWTLAEIDALTMDEVNEYFAVRDGLHKARTSILPKGR